MNGGSLNNGSLNNGNGVSLGVGGSGNVNDSIAGLHPHLHTISGSGSFSGVSGVSLNSASMGRGMTGLMGGINNNIHLDNNRLSP